MSGVVDLIEAGGVLCVPSGSDFEDVISALVDLMIGNRCLPAEMRAAAISSVCEREKMSSTAIVEIGVSIPHARLDGVQGVVCALATSPDSVYHAMTGVPISIVVLVFSSTELAGEHVNVLAGLSMLLQSETVRCAVSGADDGSAVIDALRQQSDRAR